MERINENMKKERPQQNPTRKDHGRYNDHTSSKYICHELLNQNELLKQILRDDIAEGM
jgi:hypothetical protein